MRAAPQPTRMRMNSMKLALLASVTVWLSACASGPVAPPASTLPAATTSNTRYPLLPAQRATTGETIYLANLNARIEVLEQTPEGNADDTTRTQLAAALMLRFRILGRLVDGERALDLAAATARARPQQGDAQMLYASALSAFHRFAEAEQALHRAEALLGNDARLASLRRDLLMAQGHYDALAEDFAHAAEPVADFYELAHRADLRVLQGDLAGASMWYRSAQDLYQDVDPVPLAWLHVQQGIALLRFDEIDSARQFFAAAHARLPSYALATEHLAECEFKLGQFDVARTLYAQVIEQTGNPEFLAALARLERAAGHVEAAAQAQAAASAGYAELLQRHRAAYAQHAADYYLSIGDSESALRLARENLALRADLGSLILLAHAAAAAGEHAEACAAVVRIESTGLHPPELRQLGELQSSCRG
jgi:tetratricopeptide (TPR) repeat protein